MSHSPDATSDEERVSVPKELLAKLAVVHRGWCNYCKGNPAYCGVGFHCSLRDCEIECAPLSETATREWITCPATGQTCKDYCDPGKGDRCAVDGGTTPLFAPSARATIAWNSAKVIPPENGRYYLALLKGDVASEANPMLWMDGRWRYTDGSEVSEDIPVEWWMQYPEAPHE